MLITGSALRDERAYDDPDRFDVTREADPSTLFFGYGIHRCIGAHLARLEIKLAFEETLARFPDFAVDESRAERKVSTNVRGVAHLHSSRPSHHSRRLPDGSRSTCRVRRNHPARR